MRTGAVGNVQESPEVRFTRFIEKILYENIIKNPSMKNRVCIFVPSYFDFLRLSSHLGGRDDISFASISEYSTDPEIVGARSKFFNGHVRILLVTERFLFFKRTNLRGIEHLIFYSLPVDPHVLTHVLQSFHDHYLCQKKGGGTNSPGTRPSRTPLQALALIDDFDYLALERSIGKKNALSIIENAHGESDLFIYKHVPKSAIIS